MNEAVLQDMGCRTTYDNREAVVDADVSLIAVKPNVMELVLSEVKDLISGRGPLVASVAMGEEAGKCAAMAIIFLCAKNNVLYSF